MITASGVAVFPGGTTAPSVDDLALALSRIPRFCGHTKGTGRGYTVAEHSLAGADMAKVLYPKDPAIELLFLVHDCHEAVTNDMPTTWKPRVVSEAQEELDDRLYASLGIKHPTEEQARWVKHIDRAAGCAEAKLVGPPGVYEWFVKTYGATAQPWAMKATKATIATYGKAPRRKLEAAFRRRLTGLLWESRID